MVIFSPRLVLEDYKMFPLQLGDIIISLFFWLYNPIETNCFLVFTVNCRIIASIFLALLNNTCPSVKKKNLLKKNSGICQ